ncbi:uncharacterized protein LOC144437503 isoform X2 [Glandiceps talaboti]
MAQSSKSYESFTTPKLREKLRAKGYPVSVAAKTIDPFRFVPMQCNKCNTTIAKRQKNKHIDQCWCEDGEPNAFLVQVQSTQWSGAFELLLGLPLNATFRDLDKILRRVWMECCGHLSHFIIKKKKSSNRPSVEESVSSSLEGQAPSLDSIFAAFLQQVRETDGTIRVTSFYDPREDELMSGDKPMTEKLSKYCTEDISSIRYEYDMGTTTEVVVKFLGKRRIEENILSDLSNVLIRNVMPDIKCQSCGIKGEWLTTDFKVNIYCSENCAAGDGTMAVEMMLPFVNSPRSGSCGFNGYGLVE